MEEILHVTDVSERGGWSNMRRSGETEKKGICLLRRRRQKRTRLSSSLAASDRYKRQMSVLCAEEHWDGHRLGVWGEINPFYGFVFAAFLTTTENSGSPVTSDVSMTTLS